MFTWPMRKHYKSKFENTTVVQCTREQAPERRDVHVIIKITCLRIKYVIRI
jgi:hypothetical protein